MVLPELRLVRATRTVNATDRTEAVRVDLTATEDQVDLTAADRVALEARTEVQVDLTVVVRVALADRAEALLHHQITLQQIKLRQRKSLQVKSRLTAAKIEKKLLTKTSSLRQRKR